MEVHGDKVYNSLYLRVMLTLSGEATIKNFGKWSNSKKKICSPIYGTNIFLLKLFHFQIKLEVLEGKKGDIKVV